MKMIMMMEKKIEFQLFFGAVMKEKNCVIFLDVLLVP
jgi:hypothetical protein